MSCIFNLQRSGPIDGKIEEKVSNETEKIRTADARNGRKTRVAGKELKKKKKQFIQLLKNCCGVLLFIVTKR